jgi:PAS domain S-box-containing protein
MSLRTKTFLLITLLFSVIFGGGGFLSLQFFETSLRKSNYDGLERITIAEAESISKFLDDTLRDTQVIASFLPKNALEEKDVFINEGYLKVMMKNYPKFENGMFLLDAQGTLWADYPVYPKNRGKNFAFREYFKTTMGEQRGVIGVPYRSAITGEPVLTFTALLRGSKNQVLGIIGCSVQLLHPNALGSIRKMKIGKTGHIYVFDTSRMMILHPEEGRILERDNPQGANKLFDAAIEGFEGVGETVDSRGIHMLLSLKRVAGINWIIGAQQPKKEVFAPIKEARTWMMWGTMAAFLIAVGIGALAVRRLTEPLVKLRKVAMEMGQERGIKGDEFQKQKKDLQEELRAIQSSDEIGSLANAFSQMHDRLDQAFMSLQGSLRVWEWTFDSVADPIFILDSNDRILRLNHAAAHLLKRRPQEVLGETCYRLIHGTEAPPDFCPHHITLKTGKPAKTVVEEPYLGGFYEIATTPIVDEAGQVIGSVHVTRDITERKRMEEALKLSEEKYRSVVANANDSIFIAQDGIIKFPNPSALKMTGISPEKYATTPFINLIHPEDREMVLDRHNRRLKGEEVPNNYSFRVLNKAGEELWVQLNAVSINWEGTPAVLCFLRDITSQKRLEAQFQQAQKMEAVGTLAGGIAHDFNNLLQSILGYTEILLMDNQMKTTVHQDLQEIKRVTQRGAELTRQLLTFSRKVQSRLRSIDLNKEVIQVEKLLRRTIPKMIEIELHLADDLGTVNADPAQVEQVLMNLAVNSRDAMPEGGKLVIETENVTLDETFCKNHLGVKPGGYVALTVSDTGHGMDKETIKHIFDPFYTTKGVGKGTGLGLAMVYGIVKSHEGYILCESKPNKGATFRIYFPVTEQGRGVEEWREDKGFKGGSETILLVDDEEPIRNLGEQIFTKYGYTVLKVSDGEGALKIYEEKKDGIDLIILDLIMPGMGGKKCLEGLLQINPDVKVVIASGYSPEGRVKSFFEEGAKNFISKPFNMKEMLQVVREVLDEGTHS